MMTDRSKITIEFKLGADQDELLSLLVGMIPVRDGTTGKLVGWVRREDLASNPLQAPGPDEGDDCDAVQRWDNEGGRVIER